MTQNAGAIHDDTAIGRALELKKNSPKLTYEEIAGIFKNEGLLRRDGGRFSGSHINQLIIRHDPRYRKKRRWVSPQPQEPVQGTLPIPKYAELEIIQTLLKTNLAPEAKLAQALFRGSKRGKNIRNP